MKRRWSPHWKSREEVTYPKCFWLQLGACSALFLVIFALKQVQAQPVQAALATVRSVATTEMEWDDTIGKLEFVDNLLPESVLVFWNAQERTLLPPFDGGVLLDMQGDFAVFEGKGSVQCGGEGVVQSIMRTNEGYTLTIAHDNGFVTTLTGLKSVHVAARDRVHEGQSLGTAQTVGQGGRAHVQVTEGRRVVEAAQWLR